MKTGKFRVTTAFLSIYVPVVLVVALVSWGVYYFHFIKTQQEILLAHEDNMVALQKIFVRHIIKSVIADLSIISEDLNFEPVTLTGASRSVHVTKTFLTFSKYKGIYDQVRVLDTTGMEQIRVDLRGATPVAVPRSKLQFKGNRYYFKDTIGLKKGEIYMSPFDLNIEQGKIERPLKPMIRFGQVLWNPAGQKQGVLILNYLGNNLIRDMEKLSYQSPGHLLMTNAQGYWLKAGNPEDEWGFMVKDRRDRKIQTTFPELWQAIQKQDRGQLMTEDGLFSFEKIYLLDQTVKSSTGAVDPNADSRCMLTDKECYWVILSHVLPAGVSRKNIDFLKALIYGDLFILLLTGFLTWEMIKARNRRKIAEQALQESHHDLEKTVILRTRELQETNQALKNEIQEHKKSIQQRLQIESQLRQAQKMEALGTLAGGIAHDFNNILTPILGFAEMASAELEPGHSLAGDMGEIIKAANRARELVQVILTFSRQTEQKLSPLKIQQVIQEALKLLRSSIPSTITIHDNLQKDCGPVMADPIQVHQIVMNLCTNAYHSMRKNGGSLTIRLKEIQVDIKDAVALPPGPYAKLAITDTGEGIPEKFLDKIFEPYFTTKEKGEGTGLGLAVVHSIIRSLNGNIFVESTPGSGTCFQVFLPLAASLDPSMPRTEDRQAIITGNERILVVDDDSSVLNIETRILTELGYQVTAAGSSRAALDTFTADPGQFDLIITDMTMPEMTGIELIQQILSLQPRMKIILCTGYNESLKEELIRELGISSFFTKPVALSVFARTVRQVLDRPSPA